MTLSWTLRSFVVPCLVASGLAVSLPACDPGDTEASDDPDQWSRELFVESFAATIVDRHSYGGCTYVSTYEVTGDGESCSAGALHVGVRVAGGDRVSGGFVLCGAATITTDHDEACGEADETITRPLAEIGFIELSAADADAPMTMRWRWAEDLVLETEIESARALGDGGEVSLQFVDSAQASGAAEREVSIDAGIVLASEPEETGGCGAAAGRPGAATFRCG